MQLNDWPIAYGIISTLMSLWRQRWIDASWSACFAAYLTFTMTFPDAIPWQLTYLFLLLGVGLVGYQIIKDYKRYKKSLAVQ